VYQDTGEGAVYEIRVDEVVLSEYNVSIYTTKGTFEINPEETEGGEEPAVNVSASCTPPAINNDWTINETDNCVLQNNTYLGTGKLIITRSGDAGEVVIQSNITAAGYEPQCDGGCNVALKDGWLAIG